MKLTKCFVVALLAFQFIFQGLHGQESLPSAASLLPDTAQGFVRIADLPRFVDRCNATQLGTLAQDPRLADFWKEQRQEIEKRFGDAGWELNMHPEDIYEIASGQVALCWMSSKSINKPYAVALIVDVDGRQQEVEKLLKRVNDELSQKRFKIEKLTHSGQNITQYTFQRPGETLLTRASYAVVNNQLIASDDTDVINEIIDARLNGKKTTLAGSELYQKANEHFQKGQNPIEIEYFARPFGLAQIFQSISKKDRKKQDIDILQVLRNQGFDKIAAVAGQVEVADKNYDILHRAYVQTLPPLSRSVQILDFPNSENRTIPNWVSKDAATFMSLSWNIKDAFWKVEGIVDEFVNEGFFKELVLALKTEAQGPQIDIEKEILPYLTNEIYATSTCIEPITPNSRQSVVAIRLTDPAKLTQVLDRYMKNEPDVEFVEYEGKKIWKKSETAGKENDIDLDFGNSPFQKSNKTKPKQANQPILSTWAVSIYDDYFLFGSNEETIKNAFRISKSSTAENALSVEPDVARVQQAIAELSKGQTGQAVWQVNRADRSFEMQYELFRQDQLPQSKSMLASVLDSLLNPVNEVREKNQRVKGGKLPPFAEIRKFFMPGGTVVETKPDGWEIQSFILSKTREPAETASASVEPPLSNAR